MSVKSHKLCIVDRYDGCHPSQQQKTSKQRGPDENDQNNYQECMPLVLSWSHRCSFESISAAQRQSATHKGERCAWQVHTATLLGDKL